MKFPAPLITGRLIKRYKRFLADIELAGGEKITAHCPNPGSMIGLAGAGAEVWLQPAANPKSKLSHSWELVRAGNTLVGINTGRANPVAAEAIRAGKIPELAGYSTQRREVKYGANSRIDLLLEEECGRSPCYVEVKSVTLCRNLSNPEGRLAEFPDSVTARGARHLAELQAVVAAGQRAVMLFMVQRGDCRQFSVARDLDPLYAERLRASHKAGVELLAYDTDITLEGINVRRRLAILL